MTCSTILLVVNLDGSNFILAKKTACRFDKKQYLKSKNIYI